MGTVGNTDESEVYLFISHIPQVTELRLKPTNKQRDKTIKNQKFLPDPITPVHMKCFFYRSRGKLIIHDKTVTRTFDLRNAAQKGSSHLPLPWRVSGLFTVPFFFTKIVKIENLPLRAAILVSNVPRKRVPALIAVGKGRRQFLSPPKPSPHRLSTFDTHTAGLDSVHLKLRWLPIKVSARSRPSHWKIGDCEQWALEVQDLSLRRLSRVSTAEYPGDCAIERLHDQLQYNRLAVK